MFDGGRHLDGDEHVADTVTVVHYTGPGCSAGLTIGDFRRLAKAYEVIKSVKSSKSKRPKRSPNPRNRGRGSGS